jgi:hypothetical protein
MTAFDRNWLARPILTALGCGSWISLLGCGQAVGGLSEEAPGEAPGVAGITGSGARNGNTPGASQGAAGSAMAGGYGGTGSGGYSGDGGYSGYGGYGSGGYSGSSMAYGGEGGAAGTGMGFPEYQVCTGQAELSPGFPTQDQARLYCAGAYRVDQVYQGVCLPHPGGGLNCEDVYTNEFVADFYSCGYQQGASFFCGPEQPPAGSPGCFGDECCYVLGGGCPIGRPFLVAGVARTAQGVPREDWLNRLLPDVSRLDVATRCALADAYRKDGLGEHASVASFARFVLECLALGAPAELVSDAQAALRDEIEHAKLSFGLASAYAGQALGPGALDVGDCLPARPDAHQSALRAIREGCIAETVSAALLRRASDAATDPTVKAVLARVAADERRHAVLAWRFVRWLIGQEGASLATAAAREFARAPRYVGFGATTELEGDAQALRAHGYLPLDERRSIALQTLRQVVLPCSRALGELAGRPASSPPPRGVSPEGDREQLV